MNTLTAKQKIEYFHHNNYKTYAERINAYIRALNGPSVQPFREDMLELIREDLETSQRARLIKAQH